MKKLNLQSIYTATRRAELVSEAEGWFNDLEIGSETDTKTAFAIARGCLGYQLDTDFFNLLNGKRRLQAAVKLEPPKQLNNRFYVWTPATLGSYCLGCELLGKMMPGFNWTMKKPHEKDADLQWLAGGSEKLIGTIHYKAERLAKGKFEKIADGDFWHGTEEAAIFASYLLALRNPESAPAFELRRVMFNQFLKHVKTDARDLREKTPMIAYRTIEILKEREGLYE